MIPYRVVLSTWMDQMQLSRVVPGACIGFSIEPTYSFEDRCGMGTSTRKTIQNIWGNELPDREPLELAKIAFAVDNIPKLAVEPCSNFPWGSYAARYITGSIDPITLIVPGISRCHYDGGPWPSELETIRDEKTLKWIEDIVTLEPSVSRPNGEAFHLEIKPSYIKKLSDYTNNLWESIKHRDLEGLVEAVNGCRNSISCFSDTYLANGIKEKVEELHSNGVLATFPQGAGCGGYIACISENPKERIRVKLRRY